MGRDSNGNGNGNRSGNGKSEKQIPCGDDNKKGDNKKGEDKKGKDKKDKDKKNGTNCLPWTERFQGKTRARFHLIAGDCGGRLLVRGSYRDRSSTSRAACRVVNFPRFSDSPHHPRE